MLKIGVRAHDFGRQGIATLAENIKQAGFDCVQLAPTKAIDGINSFAEISENHLEEIHSVFEQNSLEITVLGCYIEPSITDNIQRQKNVEIFRQNLTNAKKLGVQIVGTETTNLDIDTPTAEREKIYALLKDSVLRMVEQAEKENVLIGIEPVAEHTLNTPQLTRRLLDEVNSNKLKIIFDPVNMVLPRTIHEQDKIFNEFFVLLGEEIVAVHIKDITIENNQKTWRNIGEGVINYALIAQWLRTNKPNIRILREGVSLETYKKDILAMERMTKNEF
jgi:sugar phosphate isomerase/epimerase